MRSTKLREAETRAIQAERLAAVGQMVTIVTHESRNALQRSRAFLEELRDILPDRPDALELIDGIRRGHDELKRILEETRAFAAPVTLDRSICDLRKIWRQAWDELGIARKNRDASLREETNGTLPQSSVDYFRVLQVFRNLFENSLAACRDPVRIEVRCTLVEHQGIEMLRVAIRDNGPGLSAEQKRRAFEPFYTTKPKGTGLGLAIVKRFMEAHGGHIVVTDAPQRGAEFVILLPRGTARE
jgi:hypothetical protein